MVRRLWLASLVFFIVGVLATMYGQSRENRIVDGLVDTLMQGAGQSVGGGNVDFNTFSTLPVPVARYFKHVLMNGQPLIAQAKIRQSGELRSDTVNENWYPFTASHLTVPPVTGFAWIAKAGTPFASHLRVLDSYRDGAGASRVSLYSAFNLGSDQDSPELNAATLQRYLAEAVWAPTALLPQFGVAWTEIDDTAALATLSVKDTTVSLEFRFNQRGEVTSVYTPARFRLVDGGYKAQPWEGRFSDYQLQSGMKVPHSAVAGWLEEGVLKEVWRGNLVKVQYKIVM